MKKAVAGSRGKHWKGDKPEAEDRAKLWACSTQRSCSDQEEGLQNTRLEKIVPLCLLVQPGQQRTRKRIGDPYRIQRWGETMDI